MTMNNIKNNINSTNNANEKDHIDFYMEDLSSYSTPKTENSSLQQDVDLLNKLLLKKTSLEFKEVDNVNKQKTKTKVIKDIKVDKQHYINLTKDDKFISYISNDKETSLLLLWNSIERKHKIFIDYKLEENSFVISGDKYE